MVRAGLLVAIIGAIALGINIAQPLTVVGIALIGLGFAPIYPGLIHITPERFGLDRSSKIMSLQMVGGYIGASIIPPFIGVVSGLFNLIAFAIIVPLTLVLLIVSTEALNKLSSTHR